MLCFASSVLLRFCAYASHQTLKKDDKYLAPPEIFFVPSPRLCWVGYGPDQEAKMSLCSCSLK